MATRRSLRIVIACLLLAMTVTGPATSGVVLATAEAAADLDYRVIVLSDCVADSDPEVNRVLLDKLLPIRADVIDSAQYMGSLHP
jgi:nicotinamidase-related amidase